MGRKKSTALKVTFEHSETGACSKGPSPETLKAEAIERFRVWLKARHIRPLRGTWKARTKSIAATPGVESVDVWWRVSKTVDGKTEKAEVHMTAGTVVGTGTLETRIVVRGNLDLFVEPFADLSSEPSEILEADAVIVDEVGITISDTTADPPVSDWKKALSL